MKIKAILFTSTLCVLFTTTAFPQGPQIWRVDNNPGNPGDFTTLQEAHDDGGVIAGDTLYVAGSGLGYGSLILTKTLFIFGPGYFLSENPDTQAKPVSAQVGAITFDLGSVTTAPSAISFARVSGIPSSAGSMITGMEITDDVSILTNAITLKRNYIHSAGLSIAVQGSNTIIMQNYVDQATGISTPVIDVAANMQDNIIRNNFIEAQDLSTDAINSPNSATGDFRNNVIWGNLQVHNTIFYNNIQRSGTFSGTSNDVQNNIGDSSQFGIANGNQSNVSMSSVFVGTGSTDGQWDMAVGSPGINAGKDGTDAGMFGGSEPYVPSGLPVIPAIYFFDAPTSGSTSSGLPVQIKIKSHN